MPGQETALRAYPDGCVAAMAIVSSDVLEKLKFAEPPTVEEFHLRLDELMAESLSEILMPDGTSTK